MKTRTIVSILAIFVMAVFAVIPIASAQEEAAQDANVTPEELGVSDQRVLPDSPFYGIKEAWRGVKKAFTFSAEGKARRELQYASEKLIEAQKLADKDIDESEKTEAIEKSVEDFEKQFAAFKERAAGLDQSASEEINNLKKNAVRFHLQQSIILNKLENQVPEHAFVKIKEARERVHAHFAEVVSGDLENLPALIDQAVGEGSGSQFKDLQAMEFIKAIEEQSPESGKEAMRQARQHLLENFEDRIAEIPQELRVQRMEQYVQNLPGDETKRMVILDEIKQNGKIPDEVLQEMELMKAKMAERFNERLKQFQTEDARAQLFANLQEGDLEDVRVLEDLQAHSADPETRAHIQKQHQEGLQKFREKFTDTDSQQLAGRAEELMRQVRGHPDPKTFRLLEDLKAQTTPEQRAFIDSLERGAADETRRRFNEERENYTKRLQSANPEDFEFFDNFQGKLEQFGGEWGNFNAQFDRQARQFSETAIEERIREFKRPENVEEFGRFFKESSPDFRAILEQHKVDIRDRPASARERERDLPSVCAKDGGRWTGQRCEFSGRPGEGLDNAEGNCAARGGSWNGRECISTNQSSPDALQEFAGDLSAECARKGGVWNDDFCKIGGDMPSPDTRTDFQQFEQREQFNIRPEGVRGTVTNFDIFSLITAIF